MNSCKERENFSKSNLKNYDSALEIRRLRSCGKFRRKRNGLVNWCKTNTSTSVIDKVKDIYMD